MFIAKDKMVTLTYELRLDSKENEVFEKTSKDNPLVFLYGVGLMLPEFESRIEGMSTGQEFNIEISTANAYGEINEERIIELPKSVFETEGEFDNDLVRSGNSVPMVSSSGQRMTGVVLEVREDVVKIDFNHPLAGEDLHFKGKILEVRDATEEELKSVTGQDTCGCVSSSCTSDECQSSCSC